jgi:hypothetical protein
MKRSFINKDSISSSQQLFRRKQAVIAFSSFFSQLQKIYQFAKLDHFCVAPAYRKFQLGLWLQL